MNVIVCIDDDGGMLFNKRRQSRDRVLLEDLLAMVQGGGNQLWIAPFSAKLFGDVEGIFPLVKVDEAFLDKAGEVDFCFVENESLLQYEERIDSITVYRWNRSYPADTFLDIDLTKWQMEDTKEFAGSSHEKITKEIYRR